VLPGTRWLQVFSRFFFPSRYGITLLCRSLDRLGQKSKLQKTLFKAVPRGTGANLRFGAEVPRCLDETPAPIVSARARVPRRWATRLLRKHGWRTQGGRREERLSSRRVEHFGFSLSLFTILLPVVCLCVPRQLTVAVSLINCSAIYISVLVPTATNTPCRLVGPPLPRSSPRFCILGVTATQVSSDVYSAVCRYNSSLLSTLVARIASP